MWEDSRSLCLFNVTGLSLCLNPSDLIWSHLDVPWCQTERQRHVKEDPCAAKREPSANIYCCQSRSACGELFLAGAGPVPTTHNTKTPDLTDSLSVEISFNLNSMLTSPLRVNLSCALTQTQTKTLRTRTVHSTLVMSWEPVKRSRK